MRIYKVCPTSTWNKAIVNGEFTGAGIDLEDGYIHFSTGDQLKATVELHFRGQKDLCIIAVWSHNLDIKWEAARNGQLFPHLYGRLPLTEVAVIWNLNLSANGTYEFPPPLSNKQSL